MADTRISTRISVEDRVDAAERQSDKILFDLAVAIFNEYVKPLCEKRGWLFIAGNGTYLFEDEKGDTVYFEDGVNNDDPDEEFGIVVDICDITLRDMPIGAWMPDYKKES